MPSPWRASLAVLVLLVAACSAHVRDDASEDPGIVAEPVVPGACLAACQAAASGDCDWQGQCSADYAGSAMVGGSVFCGSTRLSCDDAQHAAVYGSWGLSYCCRGCEGLAE